MQRSLKIADSVLQTPLNITDPIILHLHYREGNDVKPYKAGTLKMQNL